MACSGMLWDVVVCCGMLWYIMVRYGMVLYDKGVIRRDETWKDIVAIGVQTSRGFAKLEPKCFCNTLIFTTAMDGLAFLGLGNDATPDVIWSGMKFEVSYNQRDNVGLGPRIFSFSHEERYGIIRLGYSKWCISMNGDGTIRRLVSFNFPLKLVCHLHVFP